MTNKIDMPNNPYEVLNKWLAEAEKKEINDYNAMSLATATTDGIPSVRIVLLKGLDENGLVFYTNASSRKGQEINANKHAALCFHWKSLLKQVRVEGIIEEVSNEEADAYYSTRHRSSRVGAWASKQSEELGSREELKKFVENYEAEFEGKEDIPRPPYWKGFRVKPTAIEFWVDGEYRLHERYVYKPDDKGGWTRHMLYP